MADDLTTMLTVDAQSTEDEQRLAGNIQDAIVVDPNASFDNPGGSTPTAGATDDTGIEVAPDSQPPAVNVSVDIPSPSTYDTGGAGDLVIPPPPSNPSSNEPTAPQDPVLTDVVDAGGLTAIPSIPQPAPAPEPTPGPEPTPAPEPIPAPGPIPIPEPAPAPQPAPIPPSGFAPPAPVNNPPVVEITQPAIDVPTGQDVRDPNFPGSPDAVDGIVAEYALTGNQQALRVATGTITVADPDGASDLSSLLLRFPEWSDETYSIDLAKLAEGSWSPIYVGVVDGLTTADGDGNQVPLPQGYFELLGYNPVTGVIQFSYTITSRVDNDYDALGADNPDFVNPSIRNNDATIPFEVVAVDRGGSQSLVATSSIKIIDDIPLAQDDSDSASLPRQVATGNLLSGFYQGGIDGVVDDVNAADGIADDFGADGGSLLRVASPDGSSGQQNASNPAVYVFNGFYGSLAVNLESGDYAYTPNADVYDRLGSGESLEDIFRYVIQDNDADVSSARLTITITGTNDGPSIGDVVNFGFTEELNAASQDLSASGTVFFRDIDSNDVVDISAALTTGAVWSGGSISQELADQLTAGFSTGVSDAAAPGSTPWSYSVNDANLDFLSAGETITFTYTLTATDSQNATASDTVTVTITGTNDGPTIGDVVNFGFTEELNAASQDLSASGTVFFGDIDSNDVVDISAALSTGAVWSGGSISQELADQLTAGFSTGVSDAAAPGSTPWSYSVNDANLDFLSAGETITFTYTLTATDSQNATASDTVTVTITGTNDGPTIGDVVNFGFTEELNAASQDLSASGTVFFGDIDSNDVVDISAALSTGAVWSGGSISQELADQLTAGFSTGVSDAAAPGSTPWSYSVNDANLDFLSAGETITFTYTLTATDSQNATASDTVTVTITGTNDGPTIGDVVNFGFTEELNAASQDLSASGTVFFGDIDSNDVVDISAALSTGAVWSGGSISQELADQLTAGFSTGVSDAAAPGSTPWSYSVNDANLDFLSAGETITFTYTLTATDSQNATASDTVTVTITGTNDGPTIGDVVNFGFTEELNAASQDLSASGTVFFGDIDSNDVVDISAALSTGAVWSGGSISQELADQLTAGFSTGVSDAAAPGSTPWSYSVNDANLDFLSAGETITFTYTLTATDSQNATASDTVTVTITGTNDGPTIGDVVNFGFTEELNAASQDLSASGTVFFGDIDSNDVVDISAALTTGAVWSGGSISQELADQLTAGFSTGVSDAAAPGSTPWSYSVNDANLDFLSAGETITFTYTLTATDSQNATASDTVTVTITGTNDGPTIGDVVNFGFTEELNAASQDLSASGTVFFRDIDSNDVVDISAALTTGAVWSGGSISQELADQLTAGFSTGVSDAAAPGSTPWSYSVNDANLDFLSAGETITFTYTLTATDSQNATASDTVTVTITGTNDGPTIGDVVNFGFTEELNAASQDLSASGTVFFGDIDSNDVVDISAALSTGAVWSGGSISQELADQLTAGFSTGVSDAAAPGSTPWSYSVNDANLDFLSAGETITFTYTLTATDSQNATASDTVTVTITGTNDGPTIGDVVNFGFTEELNAASQDLSASGTVFFGDIDSNDVVDISAALSTGAVWSGGSISQELADQLTAGFSTGVSDAAAPGSTPWSYSVNDANLDFLSAGETITFTYTLTATDSQNATASDTVTVTITGTNDGPTIGDVVNFGFTEELNAASQDLSASGTVFFGDIDSNDVVDISAALSTGAVWSGGSISQELADQLTAGFSTGVSDAAAPGSTPWSYSVNDANLDFLSAGETITFTYTLTATDSQNATASDTVTVTITGTNDGPKAYSDTNWTIDEAMTSASGNVLTSSAHGGDPSTALDFADVADADVDHDVLSVTAIQAGLGTVLSVPTSTTSTSGGRTVATDKGTLTIGADGSYSYVVNSSNAQINALDSGESTTDTFNYTVSDPHNATATAALTITIFGTNDKPSVTATSVEVYEKALNSSTLSNGNWTGTWVGTDPALTSEANTGIISLSDVDGLDDIQSITIGSTTQSVQSGGLAALVGQVFQTTYGEILLNSYANGSYGYTYTLKEAVDNDAVSSSANLLFTDSVLLQVSDGSTPISTSYLGVKIYDDAPTEQSYANAGKTTLQVTNANATYNTQEIYNWMPGADGGVASLSNGSSVDSVKLTIGSVASSVALSPTSNANESSGKVTVGGIEYTVIFNAPTSANDVARISLLEAGKQIAVLSLDSNGLDTLATSQHGQLTWTPIDTNAGDIKAGSPEKGLTLEAGTSFDLLVQAFQYSASGGNLVSPSEEQVNTSNVGWGVSSSTSGGDQTVNPSQSLKLTPYAEDSFTSTESLPLLDPTDQTKAVQDMKFGVGAMTGGISYASLRFVVALVNQDTQSAATATINATANSLTGNNYVNFAISSFLDQTLTTPDSATTVVQVASGGTPSSDGNYSYQAGWLIQSVEIFNVGSLTATGVDDGGFRVLQPEVLTYQSTSPPAILLDFTMTLTDQDADAVSQDFSVVLDGPFAPASLIISGSGANTPVVIDMNGDGIHYSSLAESIAHFDFDADGVAEHTAWVGTQDAILALDIGHDGVISSGQEIAFASYHPDATTDLEGLYLSFDSNQDGKLDASDDHFSDFGVWRDYNADGITDEGEFQSLHDAGIASLDLVSDGVSFVDGSGDVLIHGSTTVAFSDGATAIAHDAEFASLIDQVILDPSLLDPSSYVAADTTVSLDPSTSFDLAASVDAFLTADPITDVHLANYALDVPFASDATTHDAATVDPAVQDSSTASDPSVYEPTQDATLDDPTQDVMVQEATTYDHAV